MKTTIIAATVIAIVIGGLAVFGVGLAGWGIGFYNNAQSLKVKYEAKVKANESDFDALTKKIKKVANVSKVQIDKLKEIYVSYADARTSEGAGAVMNWVQESVPNVDTSTFNNLQNLIAAGHDDFSARQKELIDISREYNKELVQFPGNILAGFFKFERIDPNIVTSSKTQDAFKTGKDDDMEVF